MIDNEDILDLLCDDIPEDIDLSEYEEMARETGGETLQYSGVSELWEEIN